VNLSDLDYELPPELIAQQPLAARDRCRLLVLRKTDGAVEHRIFNELDCFLNRGDLLVLNDTRVIPARIFGIRVRTRGKVEVLLVERCAKGDWRMICRSRGKLSSGEELELAEGRLRATLLAKEDELIWRSTLAPDPDEEFLRRYGEMPLPPYIRRKRGDPRSANDTANYQTVFAEAPGAIAAPTAGLHFTAELLARLSSKGIRVEKVTLHVGPGTFLPIRCDRLEDHKMRAENYAVKAGTMETIERTRQSGAKVVAVGTTVVRALETVAAGGPLEGRTELFILPGHQFRTMDALLTNFHLPRSTLLALVAAFGGHEKVLAAYEQAVRERYRFYSYGDAMLIL
jgi:S-adenosylmethionine:tRNA ribosyltransferase-isomerase